MSRHEGVSCDSCMKSNFKGKRYKCLACYDYDLCSSCYENGATSPNHSTDHAMQCIIAQSEYDTFYSGENVIGHPILSITCPICGKLGFSESTLTEHVGAVHSGVKQDVVCPICASHPIGDPNFVTDDYMVHLARIHAPSQQSSHPPSYHAVAEEGLSTRRRPFHQSRPVMRRRGNIQLTGSSSITTSTTPQSNSQPPSIARDSLDPIAELLSQLSGVRRPGSGSQTLQSTASQLQQLQWQLQLEREHMRSARDQISRIPRLSNRSATTTSAPIASDDISPSESNTSEVFDPRFLLKGKEVSATGDSENVEAKLTEQIDLVRDLLNTSLELELNQLGSESNLLDHDSFASLEKNFLEFDLTDLDSESDLNSPS